MAPEENGEKVLKTVNTDEIVIIGVLVAVGIITCILLFIFREKVKERCGCCKK